MTTTDLLFCVDCRALLSAFDPQVRRGGHIQHQCGDAQAGHIGKCLEVESLSGLDPMLRDLVALRQENAKLWGWVRDLEQKGIEKSP